MRGTEQLTRLAQRFKQAADSGLRDEIGKTLFNTAPGVIDVIRMSARRTLPRRGGLAALIADSTFTTTPRSSPTSVSVRITASSSVELKLIDDGTVRHPLFGDRRYWYTQTVTPGWFTRPTERIGPKVSADIETTLDEIARRIEG